MVPEHPRTCAVRLDAQHEALQAPIVDPRSGALNPFRAIAGHSESNVPGAPTIIRVGTGRDWRCFFLRIVAAEIDDLRLQRGTASPISASVLLAVLSMPAVQSVMADSCVFRRSIGQPRALSIFFELKSSWISLTWFRLFNSMVNWVWPSAISTLNSYTNYSSARLRVGRLERHPGR